MEQLSSIVRHPQKEPLIILRLSQLRACDNNECAAKLLGYFEYCTNNKIANRTYVNAIQDAFRHQKQKGFPENTGGWLPYTNDDLERAVLWTYGTDKIYSSLKLLVDKGFIEWTPPEHIRKFFKVGTTKWIQFKADKYNAWLSEYNKQMYGLGYEQPEDISLFSMLLIFTALGVSPQNANRWQKDQPALPPKKKKSEEWLEQYDNAFDLFRFWQHITNHDGVVANDDYLKMIGDMLVKNKKSVGYCAQAIIGVNLSDYHQAKPGTNNAGGQIYDKIFNIFSEQRKSDNLQSIANQHKVTAEIALEEFEKVLAGETSEYSKKTAKQPANKQQAAVPANNAIHNAFALILESSLTVFADKVTVLETAREEYAKKPFLFTSKELTAALRREITAMRGGVHPTIETLINSVVKDLITFKRIKKL